MRKENIIWEQLKVIAPGTVDDFKSQLLPRWTPATMMKPCAFMKLCAKRRRIRPGA